VRHAATSIGMHRARKQVFGAYQQVVRVWLG